MAYGTTKKGTHGITEIGYISSNTTINCGSISTYNYIRFDGRYGTNTVARSRLVPIEMFSLYPGQMIDIFSPDTNRYITCTCSITSNDELKVVSTGRTNLNVRIYGIY